MRGGLLRTFSSTTTRRSFVCTAASLSSAPPRLPFLGRPPPPVFGLPRPRRDPRSAGPPSFPCRRLSTTTSPTMAEQPQQQQQQPRPLLLQQPLTVACVQLACGADKAANLARARDKVLAAARDGARLVVLPECFNSPYGTDYFPAYAEPLTPSPPPADTSPSFHALAAMARDAGVFLVGGSIPEREDAAEDDDDDNEPKYYNTSLTFGPDGRLLATHRKVHLFDIDIPGKIRFRESDVLSAGDHVTVVDLPGYGRIAVALCYDIRFPELAMVAARRAGGCFALVYPGAFNTTTGPLHWRLQGQARAMDNQVYVVLCSPARDPAATYQAWGHSLVVDPMAAVLVEADAAEATVTARLDGATIEATRTAIPLRDQRRFDVYPDVSAVPPSQGGK